MIFFLGPLPPPLHGFSAINEKMLSRLKESTEVVEFNLSPALGVARTLIFIPLIWVRFFFSMIVLRPSAVYIGLSGGYRQLVDCLFILLAKLFLVPIFVHHHSFAYINRVAWYNSFSFMLLKRSGHIVLCDEMKASLLRLYGLPDSGVHVLSNVAFLDDSHQTSTDRKVEPPFNVGFLSNITRAKGIFDFFDLMDDLLKKGISARGIIAGPVDESISDEFKRRLSLLPTAIYLGAVYGEKKIGFYNQVDLLVFPTRYVNEAEPVTILEALGFGVPVVAVRRGCIGCMFPATVGTVVSNIDDFVPTSVGEISRQINDPDYAYGRRVAAKEFYQRQRVEQVLRLEKLVRLICTAT